jgi:Cu/Ag efflux pump CusA
VAIFVTGKVSEKDNIVIRAAKSLYRPVLRFAMSVRPAAALAAVVLIGLAGLAASRRWARSSSRTSTKATSRCTRCAFPARA